MGGMLYFYYGIFVGGKVGVIYYGGENKKDVIIKDDDLKVFWGKKRLVRIMYLNCKFRDLIDVIKIVEWLKDNLDKWGEYDFLKKNCEYFVIFCKIGIVVLM